MSGLNNIDMASVAKPFGLLKIIKHILQQHADTLVCLFKTIKTEHN